jgi:hypothetical protein
MQNFPWIWIILEAFVLVILVALWMSNIIDQTQFIIGAIIISSISGAAAVASLRKPKS